MVKKQMNLPYLTWGCAGDLESRISKTLFFAEKNCYSSTPSATLTDVAVSMYLAAAQSPKRKLEPGYASSLTRKVNVMPCTLMMGILYSERLRHTNPDYLQRISSADLFVVSMLVASKYLVDDGEDDEIFNDQWAEAGGLAVSTVNRLEREFLEALDWRVFVKPDEFYSLCSTIETRRSRGKQMLQYVFVDTGSGDIYISYTRRIGLKEILDLNQLIALPGIKFLTPISVVGLPVIALKYGLQRGWFSYTDLTVFLAAVKYKETLQTILQSTIKIIVACSIMYGATVAALISTVKLLNAMHQTHPNHPSTDVSHVDGSIEPFRTRVITRERVEIPHNRSRNSTINSLLHDHYGPYGTEIQGMDASDEEDGADRTTSFAMDALINRIRPCPSAKNVNMAQTLDERIMTLVLSWPHCLKGYGAQVPKKALQSRQLKLGHQELVSRFETRMLQSGSTLGSTVGFNSLSLVYS